MTGGVGGPGACSNEWAGEWEIEVGLLSNPVVARQMVGVVIGSGSLMALLLSFLLAVQGDWAGIPAMLAVSALAAGGLGLLLGVVALLMFRNRWRVRFTVDARGIRCRTVDRQVRTTNRLAILLGGLTGRPGLAGAGLTAYAREDEFIDWRGVSGARWYPRSRTIALRNGWRTVGLVVCPVAEYEAVAEMVRQRVAAAARAGTAAGPSPLPGLVARSLLIVLATVPVFALPYPFEQDLLVPLILLLFALATVWLIPLFGWVVIAAAVWVAADIVWTGLQIRPAAFRWLDEYRVFQRLDSGEWAALSLAAAGLVGLVIMAWRAVRGRSPSALTADRPPAGGAGWRRRGRPDA